MTEKERLLWVIEKLSADGIHKMLLFAWALAPFGKEVKKQ